MTFLKQILKKKAFDKNQLDTQAGTWEIKLGALGGAVV